MGFCHGIRLKDEGRPRKTSFSPKIYRWSDTEASFVYEFMMMGEMITIIARSLAFSVYFIKYIIFFATLEIHCHRLQHAEFTWDLCLIQIMNILTSAVSWSGTSTSLVNLDSSAFSLPMLAKSSGLKPSGRDETSLTLSAKVYNKTLLEVLCKFYGRFVYIVAWRSKAGIVKQ